jgi:hypothetical protein
VLEPGVAMDPRTPQNLMQVPALMALIYPKPLKTQIGKGKMVGWVGLEPTTNALKGHCSTD